MNVASLEFCKELYELSGWDGTYFLYTKNGRVSTVASMFAHKPTPAYDLGYLLRKMPEVRLETWHNGHVVIKHFTSNGVPEKLERLGKHVTSEADNPEDAACKLAIELFKQGVLKKELTPTPTR